MGHFAVDNSLARRYDAYMAQSNPAPVPHPPYSAQAANISHDYHVDPRLVQDLIDRGVIK